jgi:hypothetical protein
MKIRHMQKFKKITLIILSSIIGIIMVTILIISPVAKHLITRSVEKNSGRQISIGHVYLNPLTGSIRISGFKIYELKSDSIFFSAEGISVNIAMLKLLSKTYKIRKLTLYHPRGTIIQNEKNFNFSDLINKFLKNENSDTTKTPVHLSILNIKIIDGEFCYREQQIPINYSIKKVNIDSGGKRWDTDSVNVQFSFLPGIGSGDIKGEITFNLKTYDYRIALVTHKFDLNIIEQYLKGLMSYGSFSANIDADIKAKGNINDQEVLDASGKMAINEFHFGKNPKDDFVAFDKMLLVITELNPKNLKYLFDSVSLTHPYIKYELYDYLDNLQTMFGKNGANIEAANANAAEFNLILSLARYIKVIANSFFRSDYKINRLRIYKGDIKFNDFSTSEKFAFELYPLNIIADSIDKNRSRVNVSLKSIIKPYGNIQVAVSINPRDSSDFDMQYHFQKLPVAMFNPYIISFTSFPLDRGTLEFNGNWNVRNGMIKSTNHLVIVDPRTSKRIRNKDTKWIPVPLIMTFMRERGNVIDYEIPITGNLKDPKFHLHYVIFDLLRNVFIKPPTTPYRLQIKNVETEIEKSVTLKWAIRQGSLLASQEKFIEKMADFLLKNPDASISVFPQQYAIKEKEYILFFEAKKKYFMAINNKNARIFSVEDSGKVDKMSVKDSLFVRYLNNHIKDSLIFTIQEKCTHIIDSAFINAKFNQLNKGRENVFISYFKKRGVDKQLKILKAENVIPYNGFSFYKIEYNGEFPESLLKSYIQMNEFNNEAPRKKFKEERKAVNEKSSE